MVNWRISRKLFAAFAAIVISLFAVAAVVLASLATIEAKSNEANRAQDVLATADSAEKSMLDLSGQVRGYLLTSDEAFAQRAAADHGAVDSDLAALRASDLSAGQRLHLEAIARAEDVYMAQALNPELGMGHDPATLSQAIAIVRAGVNQRDMVAFKAAVVSFEDAVVERRSITARRAVLTRAIDTARWALLIGAAVAVGLSMLLGWLLTRMIAQPLRRLAASMATVGRTKDFSMVVEQPSNDELGWLARDFNALLGDFRAYDNQLKQALNDLSSAKDVAEQANVMKTHFLANMSHEIRTPLNGVLGMAQVMALNALTDPQKQRLEVIQTSGETLLSVLNDILDVSKIEAGRMELERAPFDIGQVAASACALFTGADYGGVCFSLAVAPEAAGRWEGDSVRVRQIILNLVSNALKFTTQGQVDVAIGRSPRGGGLVISVADTGIGIAPAVLPRLFEKFVQADNTMTRRFGGTGLGLTICRSIAELMGGAITVESTLGVGTTFRVALPLPWLGPSLSAPPPASGDARPADARGLDGLRVLASEDNATNRLVLKTVLDALGLRPTIVDNGRLAVDAWLREPFDLVLMDIQMPVMDGVAATREIRRLEGAAGKLRTPIIALSANAMKRQVIEYLAAGMDAHLAKPIQIDRLHAMLEAVRRGQPLAPEAAAA